MSGERARRIAAAEASGGAFTGRRGIVTLYRAPGFGDEPASETGGGAIGVDAHADVDVGGLALAALSGSDIDVYSRDGSIDAGVSSPFSNPTVFVERRSGVVHVNYQGGGIFANGGNIGLFAKQDIKIGAGITGAGITIDAGGSLVGGGAGGISGTNVNIDVGGSISGSISATGLDQRRRRLGLAGRESLGGRSRRGRRRGRRLEQRRQQGQLRAGESHRARLRKSPRAASRPRRPPRRGERQVMIQVTSRVIGDSEDDEEALGRSRFARLRAPTSRLPFSNATNTPRRGEVHRRVPIRAQRRRRPRRGAESARAPPLRRHEGRRFARDVEHFVNVATRRAIAPLQFESAARRAHARARIASPRASLLHATQLRGDEATIPRSAPPRSASRPRPRQQSHTWMGCALSHADVPPRFGDERLFAFVRPL